MDVVILGTGGLAKEIWGMLTDMGVNVLGFVSEETGGGEFCGRPILGNDNWLLGEKQMNLVIGNGDPAARRKIARKFEGTSHLFPSFVHPKAVIFNRVIYRGGVTIMPGCVIQPDVRIGQFTHVNMGVTIGHDTQIGDFCVINHNAGVSGNVRIGNDVLIGAGATVLENRNGGDRATIGAGAIITKDVPAGQVWISPAARPMPEKLPTLADIYQIDA